MGKKEQKLNSECGDRLKAWLKEIDMTQKELAKVVGYTQQYISDVIRHEKPMSVELAKRVSEETSYSTLSEKNIKVRASYLLGLDDVKTNVEYDKMFYKQIDSVDNAIITLLNNAYNEIFYKEELMKLQAQGIPKETAIEKVRYKKPPVIDNLPELSFLFYQLKDEANKIMWSYVHKDTSPLWSFLNKDEQ